MVVKKFCCDGTCNSDDQYADKSHTQDVEIFLFPKPKTRGEKRNSWI